MKKVITNQNEKNIRIICPIHHSNSPFKIGNHLIKPEQGNKETILHHYCHYALTIFVYPNIVYEKKQMYK